MSKRQLNQPSRRQFLRRAAAMAGAFVALGTMREASADWTSLEGYLTGKPAVGRNEDGRLEVFVRGGDNALWQTWQVVPNGGWSDWQSMGGYVSSNPAVASNQDSRLEAFVYSSDNALYHRWQRIPSGGWDVYFGLGGILSGDPTVVQNWDGRLEVFVRGIDNVVYHRWQVSPGSDDWAYWESLGGTANSNIAAIVHKGSGGLNLFWRGPNGRLQWKRQSTQNGAWEATRSLGGPIIVSDPVVAEFDGPRSDPKLVVFVRGKDNAIWYRYQKFPNSTTWSDWISMTGTWTGNAAVGTNWDGRLEVFVRAPSGAVYHTFQLETDSTASWNGWNPFGSGLTSDLAVGMNQDGRLEVFGRGADGALWHRWQISAGASWGWS